MANVTVRRETENKPVIATPMRDISPMRWMRSMLGWDPMRAWDPFREVGPMFEEASALGTFQPNFEVKETKDTYLFRADVPGVHEKDLDVSLAGNRLTVSGKREAESEDKGDTYYAYERTYGGFSRSFTLPTGAETDKLRADLKEGVLTISMPKKPEQHTRRISVSTESKKS